MSGKALLVLSDGTVFPGNSFGYCGEAIGEIVFNTSMTGYQEILTDPSYKGQIVAMTYPQIGNYGVSYDDRESDRGPKVEGFIVKEYIDFPSNWRFERDRAQLAEFRNCASLGDYLREYRIAGIEGIDTRALTRHLRNYGAQMGIISALDPDPYSLLKKAREHPGISAFDLVRGISTDRPYTWAEAVWQWHPASSGIQKPEEENKKTESQALEDSAPSLRPSNLKVVVYDFGVKFNILRNLVRAGFEVTVVPAETPAEAVLDLNPDGILLSNGPGDPERVVYGIENTQKLLGRKPVFGICLGHQILGLAMGGRTYKLKFGHHGGNHPVRDMKTGRIEITSQNHNYCVDIESVRGMATLTHLNLYDGTEEGMQHVDLPVFSVQHHPEAGPGPNDSTHMFTRFREMIEKEKKC